MPGPLFPTVKERIPSRLRHETRGVIVARFILAWGGDKPRRLVPCGTHVIIWLLGGVGEMLDIRREYIVTDDNKRKAVLIDIKTFEKIEEILESYGLGKYMEEVEDEEALPLGAAKRYYATLEKC